MKKLFVSFTSLLYALERGEISQNDLDNGLFAFGCVREHVFDRKAITELCSCSGYNLTPHQETIQKAVITAEKEGRVTWRTLKEGNMSFKRLSKLLVSNGFSAIQTEGDYCYPAVEERIKDLNVVR